MGTRRNEADFESRTPVVYRTVLPMLAGGAPGSLRFDGRNVSDLLRSFSRFCKSHGVVTNSDEMFECLTEYRDRWIGDWIESTEGFQKRNWDLLQTEMKKQFRDDDQIQQMYSLEYMERIV